MKIAVVVFKLKIFKVLRIDSASMNSPFWGNFGPLLPQIWPSIAENSHQRWYSSKQKHCLKKKLKDSSFHKKETDTKFAL